MSTRKDTVAVILAGGLGTRLRSVVSDRPKPMANIAGKPFLDYLVRRLLAFEFHDIVLCVSYMKESIIHYFTENYPKYVRFAIEGEPLGTAGALRNAEGLFDKRILLMNGDTFSRIDYRDMLRFHNSNKADLTMALAEGRSNRFGKVRLEGSKIVGFVEKSEQETGYVNAGVYILERELINEIPKGKAYSIEKEFIPSLLGRAFLIGYRFDGQFIDIGEPESYANLQSNHKILES